MASAGFSRAVSAGATMHSTESPPLAGRDAFERPLRPGSHTACPPTGFKKAQSASNRPSTIRRVSRTLARFSLVLLIGVGGTLAWQSYGGEMVRAWIPSLGWMLPASPSAELQAQLKPVALDLAIMKRVARRRHQIVAFFHNLVATARGDTHRRQVARARQMRTSARTVVESAKKMTAKSCLRRNIRSGR